SPRFFVSSVLRLVGSSSRRFFDSKSRWCFQARRSTLRRYGCLLATHSSTGYSLLPLPASLKIRVQAEARDAVISCIGYKDGFIKIGDAHRVAKLRCAVARAAKRDDDRRGAACPRRGRDAFDAVA